MDVTYVLSLVQLRGHDHDDAVLVEEPVDGLQPLHDLLAETDLVGVVLVLPESNMLLLHMATIKMNRTVGFVNCFVFGVPALLPRQAMGTVKNC